ncbi:MAG: cytochrome b6-f complex subunit PetL [Prochloraceae cyanobacterium]|nr:cytochrome b6-f complex subunit PetL [Prochloraceae cyanobacterium]
MSTFAVIGYFGILLTYSAIALGLYFGFRAARII